MSTFTFSFKIHVHFQFWNPTFTFQDYPKRTRLPWEQVVLSSSVTLTVDAHFQFWNPLSLFRITQKGRDYLGSRCSSPASKPPVADKPPVNSNPPGGNQPNTEKIIKLYCLALQYPQKVSQYQIKDIKYDSNNSELPSSTRIPSIQAKKYVLPAPTGDQHRFLTPTPALAVFIWVRRLVPASKSSRFCPYYIFQVT